MDIIQSGSGKSIKSKIEINSGKLIIEGYSFPSVLNKDLKNLEVYQNLNKEVIINERKCQVTAYYKNTRIRQIHIHLDEEALSYEFKKMEDELKQKTKPKPKFSEKVLLFLIQILKLNLFKRLLPKPKPARNFIREYVTYYTSETEKIVNLLLPTKQRNYEWGKVKTITDPRGPFVFNEIKYHKAP